MQLLHWFYHNKYLFVDNSDIWSGWTVSTVLSLAARTAVRHCVPAFDTA